MKRLIALILLAVLLLLLCVGCGEKPAPTEATQGGQTELWVLTEKTHSNGMNQQAKALIKEFEAEHENVTLRLECMPTEEEERAAYLEKLRYQILAGAGPDVYLMPVGDVLTVENPRKYTYLRVEPLFSDVMLAMRNGMFQDISEYYDADTGLGKDALVTAVMDVGVIDDARVLLPLRYDFPVIYEFGNELEEVYGIDIEDWNSGIGAAQDSVLQSNSMELASGLQIANTSLFSNWIDYERSEVQLTAEEVEDFFYQFQRMLELGETDYEIAAHSFGTNLYVIQSGFVDDLGPVYAKSLSYALDFAAIAKAENLELTMMPLRSYEGELIANVTYYAAVGAACEEPELAYDFIRRFLLEESQWENNRKKPEEMQHPGMIEDGWPVRAKGSVVPLWSHLRLQEGDDSPRAKKLIETDLQDYEIPLLDAEIDQVRFDIILSNPLRSVAFSLDDYDRGEAPAPSDIPALAKQLVEELQWHVAEG